MKILILLFLMVPINGFCDSYVRSTRWSHKTIQINDPKIKVLERFGQPNLKEIIRAHYPVVAEWSYRKNKKHYIVVTFKKGKVIKIRIGRL